jgi:excisionase family DNA binding protein
MPQPESATQLSPNNHRFADIEEAARALNVPRSWLYERTRKNAVPYVRIGKYVRFDLDQLLVWARSGNAH